MAEPEQQEATLQHTNCKNKSTASFGKSELTIMSESKMASAYSDYGSHANPCRAIVNIPKSKSQ